MEDTYMTIRELAEYLKVKQSTIYNWINTKRIPVSRVVGQWRFRKSEIDNWITNGAKKPRKQSGLHKENRKEQIKSQQDRKVPGSFRLRGTSSASESSDIQPQNGLSSSNKLFVERRGEERIRIKKGEMTIKIIVTFPKREEFIADILDINSSGLAFNLRGTRVGILPETPLKNIVVSNGKYQKTISNSLIRYCMPMKDRPDSFRIGLQFNIPPFEHSVLRRKLLGEYKIRMPRYSGRAFRSLHWRLTFVFKQNEIVCDRLLNFSKFGIAFEIEQDEKLLYKRGDVLEAFSLALEDEVIYSGRATIIDLQEKKGRLILRCSLEDHIDLEQVFFLARSKIESEDVKDFISYIETTNAVEPEFKTVIADLRFFLEKTKEKLDAKEKVFNASQASDSDRERGHKIILDSIFVPVFAKLNEYLFRIWQIVRDFDEEKYNLHKRYFREQLLHLFLLSPFNQRSFSKPLGYAGDYKMIDMLYDSQDTGESIFAKLINRHAYYQNVSKAVRNRISYLRQKFDALLRDNPGRVVKIMSVGSGPAREIQEMIKNNPQVERCVFTLVEADEEAIFFSREKIIDLLIRKEKKVRINFINKAVDQLVKEKDLVDKLGKYDLIYSTGLFDYFTLNVSRRLTASLYDLLNPGGKLIIGNFNHSIKDNKVSMDFILEWVLFYRSEGEMTKFIDRLKETGKVYFEKEATGLTSLLIIEKKE